MAGDRTDDLKTSLSLDRALASAEHLLAILRAETKALRGFDRERLSELVVQKEAAAGELDKSMKLLHALERSSRSGQESSDDPGTAGPSHPEKEQNASKRASLRGLLNEIMRGNHRNHVFVQGSLGLWQDMLAICFPSTYVANQSGQRTRQAIPTKGLALNREI